MSDLTALLDELADRIADRVADRVAARLASATPAHEPGSRSLTAEQVAELINASPRYVRAHRIALGGYGSRKLLRFRESEVKAWMAKGRR